MGVTNLIDLDIVSGIILLAIGISIIGSQVAAYLNRSRLRNAVKYEFEANPNATVEQISANTGITTKDVQAIILDLKADGELRGKFSSKTGEMKPIPIAEKTPTGEQAKFCPSCGTKVKAGGIFCVFCGAKVE